MSKRRMIVVLVSAAASAFLCHSVSSQAQDKPLYLDSTQPVERRIEDLLARMDLREKIGQMNMPCVYLNQLGRDIPAKQEACRKFTQGTYTDDIGPGGGFYTLADNILQEGA